jgi:hypothetical protein
MNVRQYLKTSGLSFERQYLVKKRVHNFRAFEYIYFVLRILTILRKGWGPGKYFSLEIGSVGEKV